MKNGKWKWNLPARSFQERVFEIFIRVLSRRPAGADEDRLLFSRLRFDLRPGLDPGGATFLFAAKHDASHASAYQASQDNRNKGLAGSTVSLRIQRGPQFDLLSVHSRNGIDADTEFAASAETPARDGPGDPGFHRGAFGNYNTAIDDDVSGDFES